MVNKGEVDTLLDNVRALQSLVIDVRDKEALPPSFFGQAFELAGMIINQLREIEQERIDLLEKALEKKITGIEEIAVRIKAEEERIQKVISEKEAHTPVAPAEPVSSTHPEEQQEPVEQPPVACVAKEKEQPTLHQESVVSTPKQEEKHGLSLKEMLEKKTLSDFRKSFSLNDRFLFKKELFGGDEVKMTKVIGDLNEMSSMQEAMDYIQSELSWDKDNPYVEDFLSRLEKRFF